MRRKNINKAPVKSRHVDLRVDQATYDRIEGLAHAANLSVSEYIRQMLIKGKVTVKVEYIIESPEIRRALAELGHIGSNICKPASKPNRAGPMRGRWSCPISSAWLGRYNGQMDGYRIPTRRRS